MRLFESIKRKPRLTEQTILHFDTKTLIIIIKKQLPLLLIFILCSVIKTNAQFTQTFENIDVIDTIHDNTIILKLKENSHYISPNYFIVPKIDKLMGLILIAKQNNYWLAYSLPADNTYSEINIINTDKYLYYTTRFTHASRGIESGQRDFNIVDLSNKTSVSFPIEATLEQWNTDDENAEVVKSSCFSSVVFDGNELTVLGRTIGNGVDCLQGGVYTIRSNKLIKIKQYNQQRFQMMPIHWAGEFATWMSIEELKQVNPYIVVSRTTDTYSSCAEDERPAYAVVDGNDTLAVVLTDTETEEYIEQIIVLSPKINFGNINTSLTAEQVIKLYPKAKVNTSELTDDEYITLDEQNITLVFENTINNRVGSYVNDTFKKLKRPSAKINYILVN